jgi:hypothetical protein
LGAALRLVAWETQGFSFHLAAGLPTAQQAVRDAFLCNDEAETRELCLAVLRLAVYHLAWSGVAELGIDVSLDDGQEEDAVLEALADFLWAHRR